MSVRSRNVVRVYVADARSRAFEGALAALMRRALVLLRHSGYSLEVYLVSDAMMRGNVHAYPAVKNFPYPGARGKFLGEVHLNPREIARRRESMAAMALHGLLHLLGYDHKRNRDRIAMERKEQWLSARLEHRYGAALHLRS